MHFEIGKHLTPKNGIFVFIIVIIVGVLYFANWSKVNTITATVVDINTIRDTHQTRTSSGKIRRTTSHKTLIHTNKGVFKDSSDFLRGKIGKQFYYSLKEDETYIFTVVGYDLGIMGFHPNIIEAKPVITTPDNNSTH